MRDLELMIALHGAVALVLFRIVELELVEETAFHVGVHENRVFLVVLQRQERLRFSGVIGGLLALAGIAVMSGATIRDDVPALSLLALLGSALCFAEAAILVRRFPPVHPVAMNAFAMGTGAVLLLAGSLLARETFELPQLAETWLALAYLVPVGSVLVFVLYLVVLRYWEASRAAYEFVLIPVVTVMLSAWLDNEPLGLGLLIGGPLVLLGVYVGALRRG
jgi:drug/metabolite transporter (DMT)-like permease